MIASPQRLDPESPHLTELHQLSDVSPFARRSQPVVFRGLKEIKDWPASSKWLGPGGVEHLSKLHGDEVLDVAVSDSNTFSGDVRLAQATPAAFKDFLEENIKMDGGAEARGQGVEDMEDEAAGGLNYYLAQCPLHNAAKDVKPLLPRLLEDISIPEVWGSEAKSMCSINLWMCRSAAVRSTLHYDGHNNLLCLVSGQKTLSLYPPNHQGCLARLQPVFVPGCNHCKGIDMDMSDLGLTGALSVELDPGDCLFIPEGWFHQVDSCAGTSAVNLWWPGRGWEVVGPGKGVGTDCCALVASTRKALITNESLPCNEQPDTSCLWPYLARRAMEALFLQQKRRLIMESAPTARRPLDTPEDSLPVKRRVLEETYPSICQGQTTQRQLDGMAGVPDAQEHVNLLGLSNQEKCSLLRRLTPEERCGILRSLAQKSPAELSDLLCNLDPLTAEVLTLGWEETDARGGVEQQRQQELYEILWACTPDEGEEARQRMMEQKEAFALQTFQGLVKSVMGYGIDVSY